MERSSATSLADSRAYRAETVPTVPKHVVAQRLLPARRFLAGKLWHKRLAEASHISIDHCAHKQASVDQATTAREPLNALLARTARIKLLRRRRDELMRSKQA